MKNNTSETVSKRKQYNEKKTKKEIENCVNSIIKTTRKGSKCWAEIDTKTYLKKKKIKRDCIQEIDTGVCLKKTNKN